MQRTEVRHGQSPGQPAVRHGTGASFESPQSERIAQLEAMAESSPQAGKLAQLAAIAANAPAAAQRRMVDLVRTSQDTAAQRRAPQVSMTNSNADNGRTNTTPASVVQLTVDRAINDNVKNGTNDETPTKLIDTKNFGGPFLYRFKKSGNVIDSFRENIAVPYESDVPGDPPVGGQIDILGTNEAVMWDRKAHFRAADRATGKSRKDRTNKWTWHHMQNPCWLELVDMNVHGVMQHDGGFSAWGKTVSDDVNDNE